MKLVWCRGRNWFAEEQTAMDMDDRRASVDGYGCGGEGGATGRFVSCLWAEIQPTEKGVGMKSWLWSEKETSDGFER
jgi:hypothetical protein